MRLRRFDLTSFSITFRKYDWDCNEVRDDEDLLTSASDPSHYTYDVGGSG